MVSEEIHTEDPKLLNLAFTAFRNGKYDEVVLKYLSDVFSGATRDMRDIWKAAYEFDINVEGIEERILCQMLYSQSFVGEKDDLFRDYVERGGREKVVAAWLSYSAFQYFVRDSITDSSIFSEILRRFRDVGELSDAESLALTRHIAEENPGNGGLLREAAELVKSLMERGIVMEYFSVFRPFIPALLFFQDRRYVEYRTEPGRQVMVHSMLSDGEKEGDYFKERMAEIYEGIFSQNYVLFFGETLQYYITEIEEGRSNLTESGSLEHDMSIGVRGESRFDMLNDILAAHAVGDGESLFKLMEQYLEKTQAVSWLFSLK